LEISYVKIDQKSYLLYIKKRVKMVMAKLIKRGEEKIDIDNVIKMLRSVDK